MNDLIVSIAAGKQVMKKIILDGITFVLDVRPGKQRGKSEDNSFILVKTDRFLKFYDGLKEDKPKDIMEIGMFEGGSLVYFDKIFRPTKLVGLDIRKQPIEPLEKYVAANPHIKTYYARSQDKPGTLAAARSNFPGGIDLVVDDASHLYEQTKATFEMLFPMVRAGGNYIIEDWAWSHQKSHQNSKAPWYDKPALTNLIFKMVMTVAQYNVVESIHITENLACIKKSKGVLPMGALDLEDNLRGREMPMI